MKIGFLIISGKSRNEIFDKMSEYFRNANNLLEIQDLGTIEDCTQNIVSKGSACDKIILLNGYGTHISNTDKIANNIKIIADNLRGNQSINICDKGHGLEDSLVDIMLDNNKIIYNNLEKFTSSGCYRAVFGKSESTISNDTENTIEAIIKNKKQQQEQEMINNAPVVLEDEDTPEIVEPVVEDAPVKKGFFAKIFGGGKKKNNETEVPVIEEEEKEEDTTPEEVSNENLTDTETSGRKFTMRGKSVVRKKIIENNSPENQPIAVPPIIPDTSSEDLIGLRISKRNRFESESEPEEEVISIPINNTVEEESSIIENVIVEEEEEFESPIEKLKSAQSNRNRGRKNKNKIIANDDIEDDSIEEVPVARNSTTSKKKEIKQPLVMAKKHKIIYTTGCIGSGSSTVSACLGYTAALNGIKTIIIDFDIINRTQSCIYGDFENPESISSSGLISALKSPHLLQNLVNTPYNGIDILGVNISDDNQGISDCLDYTSMNALICQALGEYNLVVCDMPWYLLNKYPELSGIASKIYYVTSNDLLSMINSINQFSCDNFEYEQKHSLVISKMEFILNKFSKVNNYEGKPITPQKFSKIISELSDEEMYEDIEVAGILPYEAEVGNQASENYPASAYSDNINNACLKILENIK